MKLQILEICIATVAFSPICSAEEKQKERPDWAHFFKEASAVGTIVVADERTDGGSTGIYDIVSSISESKSSWVSWACRSRQ